SIDAKIASDDMRSLLTMPLRRGDRVVGFLSAAAHEPSAFTDEHEVALRLIADLLALALEHERLWSLDVARRKRLDAADALLPTLARALDVRDVFNQVSVVVKKALPHDRLMITSLSEDRRRVMID